MLVHDIGHDNGCSWDTGIGAQCLYIWPQVKVMPPGVIASKRHRLREIFGNIPDQRASTNIGPLRGILQEAPYRNASSKDTPLHIRRGNDDRVITLFR